MCDEYPNQFLAYYQQLVDLAPLQKGRIMAICRWSNTKFYEMVKKTNAISAAKKLLIAQILKEPVELIFTDMIDFDINDKLSVEGNNFKTRIF